MPRIRRRPFVRPIRMDRRRSSSRVKGMAGSLSLIPAAGPMLYTKTRPATVNAVAYQWRRTERGDAPFQILKLRAAGLIPPVDGHMRVAWEQTYGDDVRAFTSEHPIDINGPAAPLERILQDWADGGRLALRNNCRRESMRTMQIGSRRPLRKPWRPIPWSPSGRRTATRRVHTAAGLSCAGGSTGMSRRAPNDRGRRQYDDFVRYYRAR